MEDAPAHGDAEGKRERCSRRLVGCGGIHFARSWLKGNSEDQTGFGKVNGSSARVSIGVPGDAGGDDTKDDDKNYGKTMKCFACVVVLVRIDVVSERHLECEEGVEGHGDVERVFKEHKVAALHLSRGGVEVNLLNSQSDWMSCFDSGQGDHIVTLVGARYCSKRYAQHPC